MKRDKEKGQEGTRERKREEEGGIGRKREMKWRKIKEGEEVERGGERGVKCRRELKRVEEGRREWNQQKRMEQRGRGRTEEKERGIMM